MKNIRIVYLEIFPFWVVKFSIYLNRRVFVMPCDGKMTIIEIVISNTSMSQLQTTNEGNFLLYAT